MVGADMQEGHIPVHTDTGGATDGNCQGLGDL